MGNDALFLRVSVDPTLSFLNCTSNGHWDVSLLLQTLPRDIVSSILQHSVPDGRCADEVIWLPTTSGKFTLASTFWNVRQARNTSVVLSKVWHFRIPLKCHFYIAVIDREVAATGYFM